YERLGKGEFAGDILEASIREIEDFENFISVGYGGLPNEEGKLQLDAAYMDGSTFEIGAVAGMEDIKNPISVARSLSKDRFNIFRVGDGAKAYAEEQGFKPEDLLTEYAKETWEKRLKQVEEKELTPYDGHDTVGTVVLDKE